MGAGPPSRRSKRRMPMRVAGGIVGLVATLPAIAAAAAQDFYAGKQINLIVGEAPGGGYDSYARLLARHIVRHIPGAPSMVVQNMPGAGSLNAMNHILNVAAKDGSVIGMVQRSVIIMPLL